MIYKGYLVLVFFIELESIFLKVRPKANVLQLPKKYLSNTKAYAAEVSKKMDSS